MPYILSPIIEAGSPGMWAEGPAYETKPIYQIVEGKFPPVNYAEHIIRPHSLTHIETPAHTIKDGERLETFYQHKLQFFYGPAVVLRLTGNHYQNLGNGIYHWVISTEQILARMAALKLSKLPAKVLITSENAPQNAQGFHDPNYVLTLSQAAADFLVSQEQFEIYGTSWKSSDFNPGKPERPIHNTLFKRGLILENLLLHQVPEGQYFLTAFPLPLKGASESPVVPVLFSHAELKK
jgi:arylformamidase